jgi:hypothetical protein
MEERLNRIGQPGWLFRVRPNGNQNCEFHYDKLQADEKFDNCSLG